VVFPLVPAFVPLATLECAVLEPFDGAPMFDVCCCVFVIEFNVLVVLIIVCGKFIKTKISLKTSIFK
jgi:hypothetical protein